MKNSEHLYSDDSQDTRIIVMGRSELMQGFALLGFEVWPDAKESDVENLILDLIEHEHKAFVMLESHLARFETTVLKRIRETGGNVIVTQIPSFHAPNDYHPMIDNFIVQALGPNALEDNDEQ